MKQPRIELSDAAKAARVAPTATISGNDRVELAARALWTEKDSTILVMRIVSGHDVVFQAYEDYAARLRDFLCEHLGLPEGASWDGDSDKTTPPEGEAP